jgi:hypothetical protein
MTNPLHSEHCKCECDRFENRLLEIIAGMKANVGNRIFWILYLEDLLADND